MTVGLALLCGLFGAVAIVGWLTYLEERASHRRTFALWRAHLDELQARRDEAARAHVPRHHHHHYGVN